MPRAKKQTATSTPGVGAPPPPPAIGSAPPPPPSFAGGPPPAPPSMPGAPGFGAPPPPPSFGGPGYGVPGANVAPPGPPPGMGGMPPAPPAPGAPSPMVPPQPLPPSPAAPAPQGADLGPVLAKLEDLGVSITKSLAGQDVKIAKAVAEGLKPIGDKVTELFGLMQALYNMSMNDGPSEAQVQAHQQEAAPAAAAPSQLDKGTSDQLVATLRQYKGYVAAEVFTHFHNTYATQGYPHLTAEVIGQVAQQAGLIGPDGKLV